MFRRPHFLLLLAAALVPSLAVTAGAKEPVTYSRIIHSGNMVADKPIEIALDLNGVKLEAITFSGNEAVVVVWNRTPVGVTAHVGIALYDEQDQLIAAESDSQSIKRTLSKIKPGKAVNLKIKFKKFIPDFKNIAHYKLVLVTKN